MPCVWLIPQCWPPQVIWLTYVYTHDFIQVYHPRNYPQKPQHCKSISSIFKCKYDLLVFFFIFLCWMVPNWYPTLGSWSSTQAGWIAMFGQILFQLYKVGPVRSLSWFVTPATIVYGTYNHSYCGLQTNLLLGGPHCMASVWNASVWFQENYQHGSRVLLLFFECSPVGLSPICVVMFLG